MATLEQRLIALAQAIGADIKAARTARGDLSSLSTTAKTSLVAAINELVTTVSGFSNGASINDAVGNGATTVTWSADKIYDAIEAAKAAVTNSLVNGAASTLDTLNELATALGNDPDFAATLATELSSRVRFDASQTLTSPQQAQAQARTNIGAQAAADVGNTDRDLVSDYTTAKT